MGYRVFLFDALGISDLYAQWATVFFCLMHSVYRIFMPSGLPCFLFDALGISDLYAQWATVFFCLMLSVYRILCPVGYLCFLFDVLSVYWIFMPSGLPVFFV